jgi:hypothetical protein
MIRPVPALLGLLAAAAALPSLHAATVADELSDLREAMSFGKTSATVRYRYEHVEQSNFLKDADASTVRVALGYETKPYHGFSVFGQFEGVFRAGDDRYRSPVNTETTYPAVNDPEAVELNQLLVRYSNASDPWKTTLKYGRQEVLLGNQRIVGNVGWRQDTQTFDGFSAATTPLGGPENSLTFAYWYLSTVHRIFSDGSLLAQPGHLHLNGHIGNAVWRSKDLVAVSLYGVWLDYENLTTSSSAAIGGPSSATLGARAEGPYAIDADWRALYAAEFAQQSDYGDNTADYTADYALLEAGIGWRWLNLRGGWNVIQGDSAADRFTTPLATGHLFNGWADVFLTPPVNGLKALSVTLEANVPLVEGLSLMAVGYDFKSQTNSYHYGRELDLRAEYKVIPFDKNLLVGVKFARFIGDEVAQFGGAAMESINKFWVYSQYSF